MEVMPPSLALKLVIGTASLSLIIFAVLAQLPTVSTQQVYNWQYPAHDVHNTNHSPQNLITRENVGRLALAWLYQVPENPFRIPSLAPLQGIETTPLIVDGIVYLATPYNRVIALRADTGTLVWSYQVNMSEFVKKPYWAYVANQKSIWYYNNSILMMASDCSIHVLDALSGRLLRHVPGEVVCDIPGNTGYYWGEQAPIVYGDLLIVRASTAGFGGRGFLAAYNLRDMKLVWRWYTVPPVGGDPEWSAKYTVERDGRLFEGKTRGNIKPFPGDWGTTDLIGGGALWGLIAIDQEEGTLYASVGQPSPYYDASLRPGPNLYTMSIVAIDAKTGDLIWYYQVMPHALVPVEPGWSVILAELDIGGTKRKVVIAASKADYIYVLDALTGEPVYQPIKVGWREMNIHNVNMGNEADMYLSTEVLVGKTYCPGALGGIEAPPAYHNGVLFVASQRVCHKIVKGKVFYKGQVIDGYISLPDPTIPQNSTLYAVDLRTRTVKWKFEMPNRYQAASVVVSGNVVYAVDRAGILYMLDEETGRLLRRISLGGLGASGVSIGTDASGEPVLIVASGGGEFAGTYTPGVVAAFKLMGPAVTSGPFGFSISELLLLVIGAGVIVLGFVVLLRLGDRRLARKRKEMASRNGS